MKRLKFILPYSILLLLSSCSPQGNTIVWPELTTEARPWTRWWWPGSAVDPANIERLLDASKWEVLSSGLNERVELIGLIK